jgi:hypothetical protein
MLGLLDDVQDVRFLADIALEGSAVDRRGDGPRGGGIDIGNHHPGRTRFMKGFAQRLADAVAATGHHHDFARYLHDHSPCRMVRNFADRLRWRHTFVRSG